jgi:hypothetical protein
VKHLAVLLNLSFFTSSYLIQFIIFFVVFIIDTALLTLATLLIHTLATSRPLHLVIQLLNIAQHFYSSVTDNKEQLSIVHVSYITSEGISDLILIN